MTNLLATNGEAVAIPSLNRDGDCLSDLVLTAPSLFGKNVAYPMAMILAATTRPQLGPPAPAARP